MVLLLGHERRSILPRYELPLLKNYMSVKGISREGKQKVRTEIQ